METPVHAPYRERVRIEIKKIRGMSFKEKREYIWEYYKIPIIATVICLVLLGSFINARFINPRPDAALYVMWNAGFVTDEQLSDFSEVLKTEIVDENVNENIVITTMFTFEEDPTIGMANIQRLAAMLAAGEIDVFLPNTQILESYAEHGYIMSLEGILAEIRVGNPAVYNRIMENAVYGSLGMVDGTFEERLIGIDIIESPMIKRFNFFTQELYFAVAVTARKTENAALALTALFE